MFPLARRPPPLGGRTTASAGAFKITAPHRHRGGRRGLRRVTASGALALPARWLRLRGRRQPRRRRPLPALRLWIRARHAACGTAAAPAAAARERRSPPPSDIRGDRRRAPPPAAARRAAAAAARDAAFKRKLRSRAGAAARSRETRGDDDDEPFARAARVSAQHDAREHRRGALALRARPRAPRRAAALPPRRPVRRGRRAHAARGPDGAALRRTRRARAAAALCRAQSADLVLLCPRSPRARATSDANRVSDESTDSSAGARAGTRRRSRPTTPRSAASSRRSRPTGAARDGRGEKEVAAHWIELAATAAPAAARGRLARVPQGARQDGRSARADARAATSSRSSRRSGREQARGREVRARRPLRRRFPRVVLVRAGARCCAPLRNAGDASCHPARPLLFPPDPRASRQAITPPPYGGGGSAGMTLCLAPAGGTATLRWSPLSLARRGARAPRSPSKCRPTR